MGLVAEQFPRGGALTLNTVSAIGLLSVGIIGAPILGAFSDNSTVKNVQSVSEEIYTASNTVASFFGASYDSIDRGKASELAEAAGLTDEYTTAISKASRQSLRTTAISFPLVILIAFSLIGLYYNRTGGYKPVALKAFKTEV